MNAKSNPAATEFQQAYVAHQLGELTAASAGYQRVLAAKPDHFDALHMLGVIALQTDNPAQAQRLIEQALGHHKSYALAWQNLALAHQAQNRPAQAADCLKHRLALGGEDVATLQALADLSASAERWNDAKVFCQRLLVVTAPSVGRLLRLAQACEATDDPAGMLASADQALSLEPKLAGALLARGVALRRLLRTPEALSTFSAILALDPDNIQAACNIGITLSQAGRHEDALADFDALLVRAPSHAPAWNARALSLWQLNRLPEAEASYTQALKLDPSFADALANRAALRSTQGRSALAHQDYGAALQSAPGHAEAHNGLGVLLANERRWPKAIDHYRHALALNPSLTAALNNLGTALVESGHAAEALANFDQAIARQPQFIDARVNRSNLLARMRRFDEAAYEARAVLALDPNRPYMQGEALYFEQMACDWRYLEERRAALATGVASGGRVASPFVMLAAVDSPELQLACARNYAQDLYPSRDEPRPSPPAATDGRIRLAFVSADFHEHATAYLMVGMLERLDHHRFELFALSYGQVSDGPYRQRLIRCFDQFIDVRNQTDSQIAALMRDLGTDIAIDLKGYTNDGRPNIFQFRGAPLQVGFLGYPGTSGMDGIDYFIADPITVPPGSERFFSEQIVRLPYTYQCNDNMRPPVAAGSSRTNHGLPEDGFVYCSFNNNYKITPEVFDLWMRLLLAVSGSVLWLLQDNLQVTRNLRLEAEKRGIASDRLVFAPRVSRQDHLDRHRCADLFLDTWPVNAHTTGSDALWAGLPMVTMVGRGFAGRVAASLLTAAGLSDCIATDPAGYEALALTLALHPPHLAELRQRLADRREHAPLFDTERYARHIGLAFEAMQARHKLGLPPALVGIKPD